MQHSIPERSKGTCLFSCLPTPAGHQVYFRKLTGKGRLSASEFVLDINGTDPDRIAAKAMLKYLGGDQILHFDQAVQLSRLSSLLLRSNLKPLDNIIHDMRPLAIAYCRNHGLPKSPDLDDFAQIRGFVLADRQAALSCPAARTRILHDIWQKLINPTLDYATGLNAHHVPAPRKTALVNMSTRGLPLPSPIVPTMRPPVQGWRRSSWTSAEAEDCAFRFAEGADLEGLSQLFRRSPRAIHARLVLDGILQPN